MLRAVLFLMWRWSRWVMIVLGVIAFAVPVVAASRLGGLHLADVPVGDVLGTFTIAGLALIPLAMLVGAAMGIVAWSMDQQLGMVYFLVHPVPRWYAVLLRYTAGGILIMVPVAGLLLGALVVSVFGTAPEFLHAYPLSLTIRFAAATLVTYSVFFGLTGSFNRAIGDDPADVGRTLARLGIMVVVAGGTLWVDQSVLHGALRDALSHWFTSSWSPVALFFGRWGLFDV